MLSKAIFHIFEYLLGEKRFEFRRPSSCASLKSIARCSLNSSLPIQSSNQTTTRSSTQREVVEAPNVNFYDIYCMSEKQQPHIWFG